MGLDATVGGEDWEVLRRCLPEGWDVEARGDSPWRRARGVSEAKSLLRVLLMHLAAGCSLAETAARKRTANLAQSSALAPFNRLQTSEERLRQLATEQRKSRAAPRQESVRRQSPILAARGRTGAPTTRLI